MISCTSPRDSTYGLPISRVTRRASASLLFSTMRPIFFITCDRTGAGTSAHSRCAPRAARHASTNVSASPSNTSATVSEARAGFTEVMCPPGASSGELPPTREVTVRVCEAVPSPVSLVCIVYLQRLSLALLVTIVHQRPWPLLRVESGKIKASVRGVSKYGSSGQGHSKLGALHTAAYSQKDLQPLYRRRYAGGGRLHDKEPQRGGLRRHHRPPRGEYREQGRRRIEAEGLQEGRRLSRRARPEKRHLCEAHRPWADPERGAVPGEPGGDHRVRRRARPLRAGGHGGLALHGEDARDSPRHVRPPREHGRRVAGLHAPQHRGRAEHHPVRLLRQAVQGHLRRAEVHRLQGLRHRAPELHLPARRAPEGWRVRGHSHA